MLPVPLLGIFSRFAFISASVLALQFGASLRVEAQTPRPTKYYTCQLDSRRPYVRWYTAIDTSHVALHGMDTPATRAFAKGLAAYVKSVHGVDVWSDNWTDFQCEDFPTYAEAEKAAQREWEESDGTKWKNVLTDWRPDGIVSKQAESKPPALLVESPARDIAAEQAAARATALQQANNAELKTRADALNAIEKAKRDAKTAEIRRRQLAFREEFKARKAACAAGVKSKCGARGTAQ